MSHSLEQESDDAGLIRRLVDGELDHQSRSQWLAGITHDSPVWREVALAFVEKQLFDEALGTLETEEQPTASVEVVDEKQMSRADNDSLHRSSAVSWIAGLAACFLFGSLMGYILNRQGDVSAMQVIEPVPSKALLVKRSAAETTVPTPIGLADALSRSASPVPDSFRRALRKAGYSLSDRQRITNVSLPSGGQIELPVRHVDVKFIGISTFQ